MARTYGRLMLTVWRNDDFLALDDVAQRVYFMLISQPALSHAGCLPLQPNKWAKLATNTVPDAIEDALHDLEAGRFVLVDTDTEEVLIRSFIRHDGGVKNPNLAKAILVAIDKIDSPRLRAAARYEFDKASGNTQVTDPDEGRPEDQSEGDTEGHPEPTIILHPSSLIPKPSTPVVATAPKSASRFDEFYAPYPRKEGRGAAEKAYARAVKSVGHETIMVGLERNMPVLRRKHAEGFCVQPARWLNEQRWNDEPSTIVAAKPPPTQAGNRSKALDRLAELRLAAERNPLQADYLTAIGTGEAS